MTAEVKRNYYKGMTLAVVGTFLFALKSIFIKLAYADGANSDQVLLLRTLMASPFYAAILWYLRSKQVERKPIAVKQYVAMLGVGFMGYYLASYLDLLGLELISTQLERLTLFTYPTMIAILAAIFLKERLTPVIIASLVLCYVGIWLIYGQEVTQEPEADVRNGVLLVLGSALCYSVYVIIAKPMIQLHGSREFTSINMLGSAFFMVIHFSITVQESFSELPVSVYMYGLILAVFCTVVPSYCITAAIALVGATKTTVMGTVGPVFTILLAVLLLDEAFGMYHFLGVLSVLIGVSLVTLKKEGASKGFKK